MEKSLLKDILYGVLIGDSLGVPYEFRTRENMRKNPAQDMVGYGTHNQPPGTFSDDGSLTLCLADSIIQNGYNIKDIAKKFILWQDAGYWGAHNQVFDIGIATKEAIYNLKQGINPILAGGNDEYSNGNGSLMRILPLLLILKDIQDPKERFKIVSEVSSITHAHIRSIIACFYYLEFAMLLIKDKDIEEIYFKLQNHISNFLLEQKIPSKEIKKFDRLLQNKIFDLKEEDIQSSGYVIDTLEASIWCLFKTQNYKDSILKAVNLGEDTDTTGAVTGGLAGLLYSHESIPQEWLLKLARKKEIDIMINKLE